MNDPRTLVTVKLRASHDTRNVLIMALLIGALLALLALVFAAKLAVCKQAEPPVTDWHECIRGVK